MAPRGGADRPVPDHQPQVIRRLAPPLLQPRPGHHKYHHLIGRQFTILLILTPDWCRWRRLTGTGSWVCVRSSSAWTSETSTAGTTGGLSLVELQTIHRFSQSQETLNGHQPTVSRHEIGMPMRMSESGYLSLMIIAPASQFHVYLLHMLRRLFSIVS